MNEFETETGVAREQARALVEQEGAADVLAVVDYELYLADLTVEIDVAEETYGYLAALADVDPVRDFSHLTLYVGAELDDLVSRAPDSYFSTVRDHAPDADVYPIGEDPRLDLVFGAGHPDRRTFPTRYGSIDFGLPTMEAYRRHAVDVHGTDYDW
ncbi:hypothetical protein [Halorarum halobium]|uniref:hypothetical protein n=1 Tax=Halorarum halobium TaxID=3075121 RepID=UPI0028A87B7E|nr:hypothetical protein [Halobaculum sp. XH14]